MGFFSIKMAYFDAEIYIYPAKQCHTVVCEKPDYGILPLYLKYIGSIKITEAMYMMKLKKVCDNGNEYWVPTNKSIYLRVDFKNPSGENRHIEIPKYMYEILKLILKDNRYYDYSIGGIELDYNKSIESIKTSNTLFDIDGNAILL